MVIRGPRQETAARALHVVSNLTQVVWVGAADGCAVVATSKAQLRRGLGRTCDAVVLDLHAGFDGNALGQANGMIRGGGVMVLRLPESAMPGRMGIWLEHQFAAFTAHHPAQPVAVPPSIPPGSADQDALVGALTRRWTDEAASVSVVLADRGRGKSAGVGRAITALPSDASVVVCGPHPAAVREVLAFADRPGLAHWSPLALLECLEQRTVPGGVDVLVVDEAAQVPLPLLQALVTAVPHAHVVLATTIHGYEGTGHGFEQRLLPWLQEQPRAVVRHVLSTPIRWAAGDPLERFVSSALLLDAEPACIRVESAPLRVDVVDLDVLVRQPEQLRDLFGLLTRAHYRTTPDDLRHLLDDPGVALHAVWCGATVVAVGWLVADGGLDDATIEAVARGVRPRGAALADSFVCHSGRADAARLAMWRSVRTVVHPQLRGHGLARTLVEHEHATHAEADLIGTMFGATPGLMKMRQALGYAVVRLGLSRSARSGVPSVVMVRARSDAAHRLVQNLRADLARDLPGQLRRLAEEPGVALSGALIAAIQEGLPAPAPWTSQSVLQAMARLDETAVPLDALGDAPRLWLTRLTELRLDWADGLSATERRAVQLRVLDEATWAVVVSECALRGVHVAQRAVRRSLRTIWRRWGVNT